MSNFISKNDARDLIENHGAQLIDVRNPQEFIGGSAPGAVNIPVHALPLRVSELNIEQHVIVFCRSGARSEQAKMILNSLGFDKVKNAGGLHQMMSCFEPA